MKETNLLLSQWITTKTQSEDAEDRGLLDAAISLGTLRRLHIVHG